jgi:hypothetical protein
MQFYSNRLVPSVGILLASLILLSSQPTLAAESAPAAVAKAIAQACNRRDYAGVEEHMLPLLRAQWAQSGIQVKEACDALSRGGTLTEVTVNREERVGAYAVVLLTYTYQNGTKSDDRMTFVEEAGRWKIAN